MLKVVHDRTRRLLRSDAALYDDLGRAELEPFLGLALCASFGDGLFVVVAFFFFLS